MPVVSSVEMKLRQKAILTRRVVEQLTRQIQAERGIRGFCLRLLRWDQAEALAILRKQIAESGGHYLLSVVDVAMSIDGTRCNIKAQGWDQAVVVSYPIDIAGQALPEGWYVGRLDDETIVTYVPGSKPVLIIWSSSIDSPRSLTA